MENQDKIILGIDPGTQICGYALLKIMKKKPLVLALGIIKTSKFDNHYKKILVIYEKVRTLINEYHPDEVAIEAPFYGKNIQSMLKLGRAQGAAITAAVKAGLPIFEYAPRKIKMATTGNGNASKEQVSAFLSKYLKFKPENITLDATDALAAAVCHFFQANNPVQSAKYSSWEDFIKKNPGKIR